jgi:hypothetical protein
MPGTLNYLNLEKDFNKLLLNSGEIFLVSPFTNSDAIATLLKECPTNEKVTLITRWRVEDITSGASDVEVYQLLKKYRGQLFVNNRLHAKYYRKGNQALVGSANLTNNGFSIGRIGNLELLIKIAVEPTGYSKFESELLDNSFLVDDILYTKMSALQKEFTPIMKRVEEIPIPPEDSSKFSYWWPESRNPESLWEIYLSNNDLTSKKDFHYLSLPVGIPNEHAFKRLVLAALELQPNIQEVIKFVRITERRFGEMRQQLRIIDPDLLDTTIAWQTLFRWLLYLDPDQFEYRRPNFTEIIRFRE